MFDKIEYGKQWRLKNKDKIQEYKEKNPNYNIEYRKKNLDSIKELFKQKIKCEICNKEVGQYNYKSHLRSAYHSKRAKYSYM